jgi:hypothetical protein
MRRWNLPILFHICTVVWVEQEEKKGQEGCRLEGKAGRGSTD